MTNDLHITGDVDADRLLSSEPLALLLGMLLDQQVAMEVAFAGPAKIRDRLGSLDPRTIAEHDPEQFAALCAQSPAVHRFPGSMAARIQTLCAQLVSEWEGDAAALWTRGEPDGREILTRLRALPGFGEQKARIFLALLGKQYGVDAPGWREVAGDYGVEGARRSVADIRSPETLAEVREVKRAAKAAKTSASR
ncbi:MAG: HhH-GPD-type base excision DNA repair protein [Microcella sp.]|uniref:HhH-GPD-type base excision DNA repair protein n=1 Tax=Microcella sp. TaxID=1913979 RepID=UPI0033155754